MKSCPDRRCVPPFPVIVPDDGGFLDRPVQQPVYQRGLADTGGTDEYDRCAGEKERFEPYDPFATDGTDRDNRNTGCDRDNFIREQCRVIRKIGFVDHDHGFCAGRMGDRQVPFDPPGVEIMTSCRDNKYGIDVGRNDLVCTCFPEVPRVNTDFCGRISTIVVEPGPAGGAGQQNRPLRENGRVFAGPRRSRP